MLVFWGGSGLMCSPLFIGDDIISLLMKCR